MGKPRRKTRRIAFTTARLQGLPIPDTGRDWVHDTKVQGLCISVAPTGRRTLFYYKHIDGRPQRIRLGEWPTLSIAAARKAATELAGQVATGRDPAAERCEQRQIPTIGDAWEHWLTTYAMPHKKSWRQDVCRYNKHLKAWAGRRISKIKRVDVQRFHTDLGRTVGKVQANRVLALLRAMINRADDLGFEERNPCVGVKRFRETARERYLRPEELPAFFDALAEEPEDWRDYWIVALFTGARRSNVGAMQWVQIDLTTGMWYLSAADTKGKLAQGIVLVPVVLTVLRRRRELSDSAWVFPGPSRLGHVTDPTRAWKRLMDRAGLQDLRPHDLRRSLASWQASQGSSLQIVGESLGHRDPRATTVYARLFPSAVRESVEKATAAMLEAGGVKLVGGPEDEG